MKSERWTGHVARMGTRRGAYRVFVWRPVERKHLEDLDIDEMIILRWVFRKLDGALTGLIRLRLETGGGVL